MIWITGFYGLTIIFLLIMVISEKEESKRYGLAIDYLETHGDRRYISYKISDSVRRKEITIRDTEDILHKINTSDILLIGKLNDTEVYEVVLKNSNIIKTYKNYG